MTEKRDAFGDRMKEYEMMEAGRRPLPGLPILVRLDGKAFHTFTSGLERPFDGRLHRLMDATTRYLVRATGAVVGYTQSDEISLAFYREGNDELYLSGRYQKLTSVLASMATAIFNQELPKELPEKAGTLALFDARAWQVPSLEEAANAFLWREFDVSKNSILMVAQHYFSHRMLQGRDSKDMQEMLFQEHGINWNDFPARCKRGAWFRREAVVRAFTTDELNKLPPMHDAHKNPDLLVTRHEVRPMEMPPFPRVKNRVQVLFFGSLPEEGEPVQEKPITPPDEDEEDEPGLS